MTSAVVFVMVSVPIVWVSRRSLLHPAHHGFWRFFAFESILALLVLNVPHWFARPLAPTRLVSWLLLVVSGVLVTWSVVLMVRRGRPTPTMGASPLLMIENTQHLVTIGIYRYIRHPMYSSLLFFAWGALLKSVTPITVTLTGLATVALIVTARTEEAENLARFGDEYRGYVRRTRRFVPFLF